METPDRDAVAAVRGFNRFYTRRIGVLDERHAATRFNLAESRVLWELAHRDSATASGLARELGLDPGYLSRLLRGFKDAKLVRGERVAGDGRQQRLVLTAAGRRAFAPLDRHTEAGIGALVAPLDLPARRRLAGAMAAIESLLADTSDRGDARPAWWLRPPENGDIGWVVARHGALYAAEYGWDWRFEALVARIAADFVDRFDPAREACWIAERDGAPVGCVFLVQARHDAGARAGRPIAATAQLRLLLVEPGARGLGIGAALVDECRRFARAAGYRRVVLWTNSVLAAARAIYVRAGYTLERSEAHASFGQEGLVGETWSLDLG